MQKYSQLQAMFAISRASFRSITRSPSAVVFSLAFPLIFIIVFGFIGRGGGVFVDVCVKPGSDTQNPIYYALTKNPVINFKKTQNEAEMDSDLTKGRTDAILNIQKNNSTGDSLHTPYIITLQTSQASQEKAQIIEMILRDVVSHMNAVMLKNIPTMAEIKTTEVTVHRAYKTIDFILPGQLGFSILSAGVFGTAFVFYNLRSTLVLKRFFATPIRREFIVLGECLSRLVFQLIGATIIIVIGWAAFGFTLVHGLVTIAQMLTLSVIGLIIFMGMGFVVSGVAKNESTIPPLANIFTLPQFLLAGTFFPIAVFPLWLQPICNILPLTYLNDAMRKVAFEGSSFFDPIVGKDILILFVWGIAVYFVAVKTFKWE
jgi:ABC-2 type transport system permease protein